MGFTVALLDKGYCGAQASGVNDLLTARPWEDVRSIPLARIGIRTRVEALMASSVISSAPGGSSRNT
jgi:hypothetical protein